MAKKSKTKTKAIFRLCSKHEHLEKQTLSLEIRGCNASDLFLCNKVSHFHMGPTQMVLYLLSAETRPETLQGDLINSMSNPCDSSSATNHHTYFAFDCCISEWVIKWVSDKVTYRGDGGVQKNGKNYFGYKLCLKGTRPKPLQTEAYPVLMHLPSFCELVDPKLTPLQHFPSALQVFFYSTFFFYLSFFPSRKKVFDRFRFIDHYCNHTFINNFIDRISKTLSQVIHNF